MEHMQNQMDNLITASQHQYEAFYDKLCLDIEEFISYTAKKIIEKFKEDLEKSNRI